MRGNKEHAGKETGNERSRNLRGIPIFQPDNAHARTTINETISRFDSDPTPNRDIIEIGQQFRNQHNFS